jgi:hypothetical protein
MSYVSFYYNIRILSYKVRQIVLSVEAILASPEVNFSSEVQFEGNSKQFKQHHLI